MFNYGLWLFYMLFKVSLWATVSGNFSLSFKVLECIYLITKSDNMIDRVWFHSLIGTSCPYSPFIYISYLNMLLKIKGEKDVVRLFHHHHHSNIIDQHHILIEMKKQVWLLKLTMFIIVSERLECHVSIICYVLRIHTKVSPWPRHITFEMSIYIVCSWYELLQTIYVA